jgi:3-hydroxy-9,10-secoandrosta-1,3,5(10)-triene-9,17-dione monooxygenase reductase component
MFAAAGFDCAAFRKALGAFPTGVTVITTRSREGAPVGLTVNSFNSVSLDPPLILWSLAKTSSVLAVFESARNWAVHVLAADQQAMSKRFATRSADRFAGLPIEVGVGGVPLLSGCAARFQCTTESRHAGGDHIIFVGQVLAFDRRAVAPLVFQDSRYVLVAEAAGVES